VKPRKDEKKMPTRMMKRRIQRIMIWDNLKKRNDVTVEKKEQYKDLFNIDNDFNNLSFINRDDSGKTSTNKH
jgi:hypothetical protein